MVHTRGISSVIRYKFKMPAGMKALFFFYPFRANKISISRTAGVGYNRRSPTCGHSGLVSKFETNNDNTSFSYVLVTSIEILRMRPSVSLVIISCLRRYST